MPDDGQADPAGVTNVLAGLNVHKGYITYKAVADVFGHEYVPPEEVIKN